MANLKAIDLTIRYYVIIEVISYMPTKQLYNKIRNEPLKHKQKRIVDSIQKDAIQHLERKKNRVRKPNVLLKFPK